MGSFCRGDMIFPFSIKAALRGDLYILIFLILYAYFFIFLYFSAIGLPCQEYQLSRDRNCEKCQVLGLFKFLFQYHVEGRPLAFCSWANRVTCEFYLWGNQMAHENNCVFFLLSLIVFQLCSEAASGNSNKNSHKKILSFHGALELILSNAWVIIKWIRHLFFTQLTLF